MTGRTRAERTHRRQWREGFFEWLPPREIIRGRGAVMNHLDVAASRVYKTCVRFMLVVVLAAAGGSMGVPQTAPTTGPLTSGRHRILIRSTRDDSLQPSYVIVPPRYDQDATPLPLVVSLHTWHGDLEQRLPEFESE